MAANYRGLSIIATISKVLSAIIVERIREAYEYVLVAVWLPDQTGRQGE